MLSWLDYYNWIFGPEGPYPRPEPWVIEDDEALDDFIANWKRKQEKPDEPGKGHRQTFSID